MKKALIIYFSQGGTTQSIARQIAKGLELDKFKVDLHDITQNPTPGISEYDLVGIGSPVYIFRPPFNILEYVKGLSKLNGLPFFVFILYGTRPGTTGNILRNMMTVKGGKEIGYKKFKGADFFLGYLQRGFLFSPDNPNKEELSTAQVFGQDIAVNFSGNFYKKPDMDPAPGIVYTFENMITKKFLTNHVYIYFFKADAKKCNSCGICVRLCPKKNIDLDKNGIPQWRHNCLLCLYCEMKCPKDAIRSVLDWPMMSPFMRYNIYQADKDPLIQKANVLHLKGRTQKLNKPFSKNKF